MARCAESETQRSLNQVEEQIQASTGRRAAPEELARDRALGPVGYVGISASVLGLGSTLAGAVLLARADRLAEPTGLTIVNYRPPGWALVGVGLTAMVAGNVLLGVDLAVLRRRKAQSARVTGVGMSVAGAPGLLVEGQF